MGVFPSKKQIRPFGRLPGLPVDPVKGTFLPIGPVKNTQVFFVVKQIDGDYLLCENGKGERQYVGLPLAMQQTAFERASGAEPYSADGLYYKWGNLDTVENSDGETISWQQNRSVSTQTEKASDEKPDGYFWRDEKIVPPYNKGEVILAIRFGDDKDPNIRWLDLNLSGRCFKENDSNDVMTVQGENDDTLNCLDSNGNAVEVAKPFLLQKTPWHGVQVSGYSFNYTGTGQRTVTRDDEEEKQSITPSYQGPSGSFKGEQIVVVECNTGLTGVKHMDINTAGRCWAVNND